MSIPTTLAVPAGVEVLTLDTDRGSFAAHRALPDGPPRAHVLFVPGWTGSKEDFTQVLPRLARAGFAATAYDQRGQYETPGAADADYSLSGFADDAVAVAATGAPTTHLLGHSFGGLVAQQAVVDHADAWATLSLLCTGPGALGSSPLRPLDAMIGALDTTSLELIHEARERGVVRPADIAAFLRRKFISNDVASLRAMTQHLVDAPDVVDAVRATGLPVWVARGAADDAWPHAVQDTMARRLGTRVQVLPRAAHSPGVEDPAGLADAWLPFLQAHA